MKITIDGDTIKAEVGGMTFSFPPDLQEVCVKAAVQQEKAADWEKRCEELRCRLEKETDRADGLEKRCSELEQELRDARERLDQTVGRKVRVELEADQLRHRAEELKTALDKQLANYDQETKALRERIQEQDRTIALYDDENRELKAKYIAWDRGSTALTRWAQAIHENAVDHGWWAKSFADAADFHSPADAGESGREDVDRPLPEILMLCVCELAESMEEYRNGKPLIYEGEGGKLEGIAVEMGDCIIRVLDWMGHNGVDVDELVRKKHEYNRGRPYRHGGKKA